ncbi:conserved hypothetical protein [Methanosalsum zhilinae DSM 4017]|uniref:KaiC domain-containing protein n=2 Tax=Methanosalsum zhilinae TaxID=39669 RepID=F7XL48_METZD|nr:conserved hypothetical protein [Methanosalsum zhilinae DSM 4017]
MQMPEIIQAGGYMEIRNQKKDAFLIPTGIHGLDVHLGGGVPPGSTILILAEPGAGSSTFAQQFSYGGLKNDDHVIYFTTDQPIEEIISEMDSFGMNTEELIDRLEFVDAYTPRFYNLLPRGLRAEMEAKDYLKRSVDILNLLKSTILEERQTKYRMVIDSMSYFLRSYEINEIVNMIEMMSSVSKINQSINLLTMKSGMHEILIENTMKHACDGVIEFRLNERGSEIERSMFIRKMRGMLIPNQILPYKVTNKGIEPETTKRVL